MPLEIRTSEARRARLWIIWANMLVSVAVYAGIGYFVATTDGSPAVLRTLVPAFGLVAVTEVFAIAVLRPLLAARMERTAFAIVRWAVAESIAILGLVLRLLGAPFSTAAIFMAAGALLLAVWRPTEADARDAQDR